MNFWAFASYVLTFGCGFGFCLTVKAHPNEGMARRINELEAELEVHRAAGQEMWRNAAAQRSAS